MVRLQCPRCGTTVDAPPGGRAQCPSCGFSADAPPPGPGGPVPQPRWAADPQQGAGGYTAAPYGAPPGGYVPPGAPVPQPPPVHPGAVVQRTNGFCVAALVLGIVGLCPFFSFVPGVLAIVFGVIGKNQAAQRQEKGDGMAVAGIVLGAISVVLGAFWMFAFSPFWFRGL